MVAYSGCVCICDYNCKGKIKFKRLMFDNGRFYLEYICDTCGRTVKRLYRNKK